MEEERLVIIDTDAGIDDTLALLMAAQAHNKAEIPFRIVGITCCSGNTDIDNVTLNVTRTLDILDLNEIPIFRGSSGPMVHPYTRKCIVHGSDGFGDTTAHFPDTKPKLEAEHAVNAIIRLIHKNPGALTILALGPLTNMAMAVRMDPTIADNVKDIYIMGGNVKGAGNAAVCAEFNFVYDPEAAHVVLSTFKCPIFIIPLEIGRDKVSASYEWRVKELRDGLDTKESRLINLIESKNLEQRHKVTGQWTAYDATASAALIAPSSITKLLNYHCMVELHGNHTRGQLIVDFLPHYHPPTNVFIVTDMDIKLYQDLLIWACGGPCPL